MLAIIIAEKLKSKKADNTVPLHYCTTVRVLRAQTFPNTGRHFAHFGQFCIVSSGKDNGSYGCEKALMQKQLSFYKKLLWDKYDANLSIVLRKRRGYADDGSFFDKMTELIKNEFPETHLSFDLEQECNNYYKGISYDVFMEKNGDKIEIGGGGFVDWIQRMTNNKKDRCLISGVGLDRLLLY
jgi:phenylalanyl-tRNA synthetase alpha subunit